MFIRSIDTWAAPGNVTSPPPLASYSRVDVPLQRLLDRLDPQRDQRLNHGQHDGAVIQWGLMLGGGCSRVDTLDARYRTERHFGEGGMASVYLYDDLAHDRKVALSLLKPELAAERFVQQVKTTAATW